MYIRYFGKMRVVGGDLEKRRIEGVKIAHILRRRLVAHWPQLIAKLHLSPMEEVYQWLFANVVLHDFDAV